MRWTRTEHPQIKNVKSFTKKVLLLVPLLDMQIGSWVLSRLFIPAAPTNSISDFDDVDMTDADSIWYHCINGLEYDLPSDTDPSMIQFANAVRNVAKDMN